MSDSSNPYAYLVTLAACATALVWFAKWMLQEYNRRVGAVGYHEASPPPQAPTLAQTSTTITQSPTTSTLAESPTLRAVSTSHSEDEVYADAEEDVAKADKKETPKSP